MVQYKAISFSLTTTGSRHNCQKYKSEMNKSNLKWNSLCGVFHHNPYVFQIKFGAKFLRIRYSPQRPLNVQQRKKFLVNLLSLTLVRTFLLPILACQEINLHPNHLSKLVIFRMNVNNQLVKMKVSLSLFHSTFSYHFKPYSFPNLQILQLLAVHQLQFRCLKTLTCFITFPWDSSDCLDCHCAVT